MACPHVSGAIALLLSYNPNLSILSIIDRVLKTSDYFEKFNNIVVSSGRLNVYNLLKNIRPNRPLPPSDENWKNINISIETPHPYEIKKIYEWNIDISDKYKYLRIHFNKFITESKYDKVTISIGENNIIYSGNLGKFYTNYLNIGNNKKLNIKFISDYSNIFDGFIIDKIQVQ